MIRLIASDLDGTLLGGDHAISERTIKAIKAAQDKGVNFTLSTGRMADSAKAEMKKYGISCNYLCNSGAQIFDHEGKLLRDLPMDKKTALWVMKMFERYHVPMDIQAGDHLYVKTNIFQFLVKAFYFSRRGNLLKFLRRNLNYNKSDYKVVHLKKAEDVFLYTDKVYKISASGINPRKVERIKDAFKKSGRVTAVSSFSDNVEISDLHAQKGESVLWYANYLGIDPSEVMTIGDSDNDLSMIEADFGYTVAMGNAMDCVKNAARFITKKNTEDGVAVFIEDHVLKVN